MKKIFLLLATFGLLTLSGCNNDDDRIINSGGDGDTISEVFEVSNVNFVAAGDYTVTVPLEPEIYSSDVILVYRLTGLDPEGDDIWEQIPTTYNLPEGALSYFTDFSVNSVAIYLDATFDPMLRQDFSLNQIFRIVIVPGYFSETLNSTDYNEVMNSLRQSQIEVKQRTIGKQ